MLSAFQQELNRMPNIGTGLAGPQDLWDNLATVSVDVKNTGNVKGAEVTQLYVGIAGGPVRQLRGLDKQILEPGQSYTANFALTRRDLSIWDVAAQNWMSQNAVYQISVGDSSRNLPLIGSLTL
jgi:beta-glucosidase